MRSTILYFFPLVSDGIQFLFQTNPLTQMNIKIRHVISDLVGVTGLLILEAILNGERGGQKLAALKDHRIKASKDTLARSLQGDWRTEHLFTLRQALATWRHYQQLMADCDTETERVLASLDSKVNVAENPPPPASLKHKKPKGSEPKFDARTELYQLCGVDLTQVPGIQVNTALVLFGEVGPDFVLRFPTAKCFSSWLGLCPDNRITGGKILSVKTRDVKSRAAQALRLAAQALWRSQTYLGDCFRRWKAKLGTPKAITAMAHKLARILWHLIKYQQPYDPAVWAKAEEKNRQKKIKRLEKNAAALGFQLISNS